MKVIFDESFLSRTSNIDNTVTITSYTIGTYHNRISSVSELFNESYLSNDLNRTDNYILYAVWEDKEKILRLNLTIDDSEQEDLSDYDYSFIYCYYQEPGEESEKIAFILSGDLEKSEDGTYNIEPIDLSITRNIINVIFPSTVVANIEVTMEDDTDFLESYGIQPGTNIFTLTEGADDNDSKLVSRSSYFKYYRNYSTSGNSNDLPYLNILGENTYNYYTFIAYSNLEIRTENTSDVDVIPTDSSLSNNGGEIKLLGSYTQTKYTVKDDIITDEQVSSVDSLDNLLDANLILISGDLDYEFDSKTKTIIYKENTSPSSEKNGYFRLEVRYYNPLTKEIETATSGTLRLRQSEGSMEINIITNEDYFLENGRMLYLFGCKKGETKTFNIRVSGSIESNQVAIDLNNSLQDYFSVTKSDPVISGGYSTITITMETLTDNESTSESIPSTETGLISTRIRITGSGTVATYFYMVQSPKVEGLKLYKKSDTGYEELSEVVLPREVSERKSIDYYLAKDSNTEDPKYWKILHRSDEVQCGPNELSSVGNYELLENNNESWETGNVIITSEITANSSVVNTDLGYLMFGRVNSTEDEIDETDWRSLMTVGYLKIPVSIEGETPDVQVQSEPLEVDRIGLYTINIKSNCPVNITINNVGSEQNLIFYDNNSTILTLENYDNVDGVNVFIKHQYVTTTKGINDYGTISVTSTTNSLESYGDIKVILNSFNASIDFYDGSVNNPIIFLDTNTDMDELHGSLRYSTSITTSRSTSFSSGSGYISIIQDEPIFDKNSYNEQNKGYLYNQVTYSYSTYNTSWPSVYNGYLRIYSEEVSNNITYYFYQLGPSPQLSISDSDIVFGNSVYTKSTRTTNNEIQINSELLVSSSDFTVDSGSNGSFSYSYSRLSNSNDFRLTIRPNQDNTSNSTWNIGEITIESKVDSNNFIDAQQDIVPDYTQEEVNRIVSPSTLTLTIYQNGVANDSINVVPVDESNIAPEGESRIYNIDPPTGFERCTTLDNSEGIVTTVNSVYGTITANVQNKLLNSRKLTLSEVGVGDYTQIASNRTLRFTAIFTMTGGSTINKTVSAIQYGYKSGIIYKSQTYKNTLCIYNTLEDIIITESVDTNDTEFSFFLGQFSITSAILDGTTGRIVNLSCDNDDVLIRSNTRPTFRTNDSITSNYNVSISFPANTNTQQKTITLTATCIDGTTGTECKVIIRIVQRAKEYTVRCGDKSNGSYIYFHSSGYCLSGGDVSNSVMETNLLTNMDSSLFNISIVSTDPDIEDVPTIEETSLEYVGTGESNLTRYKLILRISPNTRQTAISTDIYKIRITAIGDDRELWFGYIKQGYLSVYLQLPSGENLYSGQYTGLVFNVPGRTDTDAKAENRVVFPVRFERAEYDISGGLLGSPITDFNENYDVISLSNYNWTTTFSGGTDPNILFEKFATTYITSINLPELEEKIPYVTNVYSTRDQFQSSTIPLTITFDLIYTYTDSTDPSKATNTYNFELHLQKVQYIAPSISVSSSTITKNADQTDQFLIEVTARNNTSVIRQNINYITPEGVTGWINRGSVSDNIYSFYLSKNTALIERTAEIVFSVADDFTSVEATVSVTQRASEPFLNWVIPTPSTIEPILAETQINSSDTSITLTVSTNISCTVSNNEEDYTKLDYKYDPDFIRYSESNVSSVNSTTTTILVRTNPNDKSESREGYIIIFGDGGDDKKMLILKLTQTEVGKLFSVVTKNPIKEDDSAHSFKVVVLDNSINGPNGENIQISDTTNDKNFITFDRREVSDNNNEYALYYDLKENNTYDAKEAYITIISSNGQLSAQVTQDGKTRPTFSLSQREFTGVTHNGDTCTINVNEIAIPTDKASIKIDSIKDSNNDDVDWITCDIKGTAITLTVKENRDYESRSATITVSVGYSGYEDIETLHRETDQITVQQNQNGKIKVSVEDSEDYSVTGGNNVSLNSYTGCTLKVEVDSNINTTYRFEQYSGGGTGWIKSDESPSENIYSFTIDPNNTTNDRSVYLVFAGQDSEYSSIEQTIQISQPKKPIPDIKIDSNDVPSVGEFNRDSDDPENDNYTWNSITSDGGTLIIYVTAKNIEDSSFSIVTPAPGNWVTCEESGESDGKTKFTINVKEYDNPQKVREGTLSISINTGDETTGDTFKDEIQIKIIQSAPEVTFKILDPNTDEPFVDNVLKADPYSSNHYKIKVMSSVTGYNVKIKDKEDEVWIKDITLEGDEQTTTGDIYTFHVLANDTSENREGTITVFYGDAIGTPANLTIKQTDPIPTISISGDKEFTVKSTNPDPIDISKSTVTAHNDNDKVIERSFDYGDGETTSWIRDVTDTDDDDNNYSFEIDSNTNTEKDRTCTIKFIAENRTGSAEDFITITQVKKPNIILKTNDNIYEIPASSDTKGEGEIEVNFVVDPNTNNDFTITALSGEEDPNWKEISNKTSTGFTVTIQPYNTTDKERVLDITVKTSNNSEEEATDKKSITQKPRTEVSIVTNYSAGDKVSLPVEQTTPVNISFNLNDSWSSDSISAELQKIDDDSTVTFPADDWSLGNVDESDPESGYDHSVLLTVGTNETSTKLGCILKISVKNEYEEEVGSKSIKFIQDPTVTRSTTSRKTKTK